MSWEDSVRDNWPILGGFAAGLVAWGKTITTVGFVQRDLKAQDVRVTKVEDAVSSIKTSIASIEAHAERTRDALEKLVERAG